MILLALHRTYPNHVSKAPFTLYRFRTKWRGNVPYWSTVYTEQFSYPASNKDYCVTKYYNVYAMPFSYENISIPFSFEDGSVNGVYMETVFTQIVHISLIIFACTCGILGAQGDTPLFSIRGVHFSVFLLIPKY